MPDADTVLILQDCNNCIALRSLGIHLSGRFLRFLSETLSSGSATTKPKRRAYLLKRKALTTGFFDNKGKDEKEKGEHKAQYRLIALPPAISSMYFRNEEKQS